MRQIKGEIRVVGFDDSPFKPRSQQQVLVVGTVYRGGKFLDGILKTEVLCDGLDATEKLVNILNCSRYKGEIRVLMFKGITMAGFNFVDISELRKKTGLPVIVVTRKKPNIKKIKKALERFADGDRRFKIIKNAGKVYKMKIKNNKNIFFQFNGLKKKEAERIIKITCKRGLVPEPLRIAHIIASGIVKGESKGRA